MGRISHGRSVDNHAGIIYQSQSGSLANNGIYSLCLSQMGTCWPFVPSGIFLQTGRPVNKPLFWAVLLTFALQMATIYVPALNTIFKTAPLTAGELCITILLSSIVFSRWKLKNRKKVEEQIADKHFLSATSNTRLFIRSASGSAR